MLDTNFVFWLVLYFFLKIGLKLYNRKAVLQDFPGEGAVIKTLHFHWAVGSVPHEGPKIPYATWCPKT